MKIIHAINPKGGSGKTTAIIQLASWCSSKGMRVAIIDMDSQRSVHFLIESSIHEWPLTPILFKGWPDLPPTVDVLLVDHPGRLEINDLPTNGTVIMPIRPVAHDVGASLVALRVLRGMPALRVIPFINCYDSQRGEHRKTVEGIAELAHIALVADRSCVQRTMQTGHGVFSSIIPANMYGLRQAQQEWSKVATSVFSEEENDG